jgi:DNA polymerase IV
MIACLTITYFAAAIERRTDARLATQPLVLGGQPWEPKPLYAYSQEVAQRGVGPGMSLRLAHTLSPQACFLPAAPERYCAAAGEIVDLLTDFTPLLEAEALWQTAAATPAQQTPGGRRLPARYYLDLERLPLVTALSLTQEMGRVLRRQTRLEAAIGLAGGKLAAQMAATLARPGHIRPVESQQEDAFLAACPMSCLPLERETARRLRQLGVQTLGQLAALPAAGLQEQLGVKLDTLIPARRNGLPPRLQPTDRPQSCPASLRFAAPQQQPDQLAAAVPRLAQALAGRLQAAGLSGGALQLIWQTEMDDTGRSAELVLRQPAAAPLPLADGLRQLLHSSDYCGLAVNAPRTAAPIVCLTAVATQLQPTTARQLPLFPTTDETSDELAALVTRLAARHGAAYFYRPALSESAHPLPERRFTLQPFPLTAVSDGSGAPV